MTNQIKYIWTQHNILSHTLVNTRLNQRLDQKSCLAIISREKKKRLDQDTTLKAFPKPQYYKGTSLINYFLLYQRLTEKKTMLVHFAE